MVLLVSKVTEITYNGGFQPQKEVMNHQRIFIGHWRVRYLRIWKVVLSFLNEAHGEVWVARNLCHSRNMCTCCFNEGSIWQLRIGGVIKLHWRVSDAVVFSIIEHTRFPVAQWLTFNPQQRRNKDLCATEWRFPGNHNHNIIQKAEPQLILT